MQTHSMEKPHSLGKTQSNSSFSRLKMRRPRPLDYRLPPSIHPFTVLAPSSPRHRDLLCLHLISILITLNEFEIETQHQASLLRTSSIIIALSIIVEITKHLHSIEYHIIELILWQICVDINEFMFCYNIIAWKLLESQHRWLPEFCNRFQTLSSNTETLIMIQTVFVVQNFRDVPNFVVEIQKYTLVYIIVSHSY